MELILCAHRKKTWSKTVYPAAWALTAYISLWGSLSSLGYWSTLGALPLAAGGGVLLLTVLLPRGAWPTGVLGALSGVALLILRPQGLLLMLNRLMNLSAAKQAYEYELFQVTQVGTEALRVAFLALGLLSGTLLGLAARQDWTFAPALGTLLLAGACAWLGITPAWYWLLALGLCGLLPLTAPRVGSVAVTILAVGLVTAAVLGAFPGESPWLSDLDEALRDRLAVRTVAYSDRWEETFQPSAQHIPSEEAAQAREFYAPEASDGDLGDELNLPVLLPVLLAILLTALALFLPAIWMDRLNRRRERDLARMRDPDDAAAVRAMYQTALRWLERGGLALENRLDSELTGPIGTAFSPELAEQFSAILPIWYQAAYSELALTPDQRKTMLGFVSAAKTAARETFTRRQKLLARYVYGW